MNKPIDQPTRNTQGLRRLAREAAVQLQLIRSIENAPQSLTFFLDTLDAVFIGNDPDTYLFPTGEKVPVIGIYCLLVPEELIYAAGAIPLRLCSGCHESCSAGEEYIPRDGCPLVKSSMGLTAQPGMAAFDLCEVVIVPTTCDAKRKFAEELSRFKEVWMLETPHLKTSQISRHAWLEQIYALKEKLERYTGRPGGKNKITRRVLDNAIKESTAAREQMRRLMDFRSQAVPLLWGRQAMLIVNAYSWMLTGPWTEALIRLNDELAERHRRDEAVCSPQTPRLLIAGSPVIFPNWKLPTLIEELGGIVVCDESCIGDRTLYDPVGHSERTMRDQMTSLASRSLMPCVCPSFAPNDDRLIKLQRMIVSHRVDGVVYHVLKGCVVYDFEVNRVEETLKAVRIPLVRIETDYSPEDVEQLRTRIEAFMEMLSAHKRNAKTKEKK